MLQKNKYVNKKEAFRMKSFFNSLNKRTGGGVFSIVLLALLLSGCPGTIGPKEDTTPGENLDASTFGARFTYAIEDTAILTWNEVDYEGLAYYKVSAKNTISSDDPVITSGKINKGSTLEWKATGLIPVMYDFTIRGYDQNGKELFYSTVGRDVYISNGILQSPNATVTDSGIKISWNRVSGSAGFKKIEILSADAENGEYSKIGTLTDFVYANEYLVDHFDFEKTYYFKLTSYDINDKNLGSTAVFSVTTPELQAPATVSGLTYDKNTYFDGLNITWNRIASATSYKLQVSSTSSFNEGDILYETTTTEASYFLQRDITSKIDVYVRVCAVNEKGSGNYSGSINAWTFDTASNITVTYEVSEQTQNSAKIVLQAKKSSSDFTLKEATIRYALLDENDNVVKDFQESNEFELSNLEFANTTVFKGQIKIGYYKYTSPEPQSYEIKSSKISVKTLSFPAPANGEWVASDVGRTSLKIQFPTLTSDQLFGVSASDIVYHISAYREGYTYTAASEETEPGNTDPIVLDDLTPGEKYNFKVYAKKKDSGSVAGESSEASELFKLKDALTQPVIKTLTETTQEAPYTHMKVTFDPIPEDTYEDIKYGIAWEIMGGTTISNFSQSSATDLSDVTSIEEKVNGGNKYHVVLYAYENNEGKDTIMRSEKTSIQLEYIDDTGLGPLGAGYYTSANGSENEGKMIDIVNPATWNQQNILSTFTPRSTDKAYSWGLIPKQGNETVDWEFIIKFGLTDEMRERSYSNLRLYYLERYWTSTASVDGQTLAYGSSISVVSPVDGSELHLFEDYSKESKLYDSFDMPQYSSNGTLTYSSTDTPDRTGISILSFKSYIFNNSIYFRVLIPGTYNSGLVDNTGTYVGFSYKY